MFQPHSMDTEVKYRQQTVQAEFLLAQRQMSISGIRQILGNTVIEMGSRIHGVSKGACPESAEIASIIRSSVKPPFASETGS